MRLPMMDDPFSTTARTYDRVATTYLKLNRDRSLKAELLDRFAALLATGSIVVDLGSGPGFDAAEFRRRGLRAVSVDYSFEMLRAGVGEFPGARMQADMRSLPIRAASVDAVWASASVIHLAAPDAMKAMEEIRRALRDGGVLYLNVKAGVGDAWESDSFGSPRWFQFWSADELDVALCDRGFAIEQSFTNETNAGLWHVRIARAARTS